MANKDIVTSGTGLEASTDFANDERNLVAALLEAAEYKTNSDETKEIKVKKNGKVLFSFHIRPLSQSEIQAAAKKATKQIPNPVSPKYPTISGERDTASYHNYLIYAATVDSERKKIWGNEQIKQKYSIVDDAETVDVILKSGTKSKVVDAVLQISGFDGEDVVEEEDFIKN